MTRAARIEIEPGVFRIIAPADTSYEWRDRKRIREKDWARIHTLADRRAPIILPDNHKRTWRA